MFVKRLNDKAKLPTYAHQGDAGMDLYYDGEDKALLPDVPTALTTGISVAVPRGCVGIIKEKSGLALSKGLEVLGGVIDSGYRGEIKVIVKLPSNRMTTVTAGQKLAQLLIIPVKRVDVVEVDELPESIDGRESNGFGSTGV